MSDELQQIIELRSDVDKLMVDSGYSAHDLGTLGGMSAQQEKWDRRFLKLAEEVASWSKDPSTKVGAVIVDRLRRVVGTGYNGFARGVDDAEERYNDRPTKYKLVVHAELNAVLTAGHRTEGGTIYVVPSFGKPPLCTSCAKAVIQSGLVRVVGWQPQVTTELMERWREELESAHLMCREAGVEMTMLVREDG